MDIQLYPHQLEAIKKMKNGCILCGGVGTGKSRTALAYYFLQEGGELEPFSEMIEPRDLYIITTARKRDTFEWETEMIPFEMSSNEEYNIHGNHIVIDSWNNIKKYRKVNGAFFIFDEQRVVGRGVWVKSFLDIARKNKWILLTATPGDTWMDYIPVFVANGFYYGRTDFEHRHVIYARWNGKYPRIEGYRNEGILLHHRNDILVRMRYEKPTIPHYEDLFTVYDIAAYKALFKTRWDPYKDKPIENAGELCYLARRVVNSDPSRIKMVVDIVHHANRAIVFYNYDYELEILRSAEYRDSNDELCDISEWNGHKHEPIPDSDHWVYLVQYTAGAEGWNCVLTDTIIFYSQNYSYKTMIQAAGRIDRLNTKYKDLFYFTLKSKSGIDLAIAKALKEKKTFNEKDYVSRFER